MLKSTVLLVFFVFFLATGVGGSLANQAATPETDAPTGEEAATPDVPPTEPARAVAPIPIGAARVSLNFVGARLVEVINVLAQHLKLSYTIDPAVQGTVTLFSAEPLNREDLLPVFHQVLRTNNAVAVKTGNLYHIAPIKDGKGLARPAVHARGDGYALEVVPVRFFSVDELQRLLKPFVNPGGEILAYPRGNFLIVVDTLSNIQRLLEIKNLIDVNVFSGVRMELYQPKATSADELAADMTRIMQTYASSVPQKEGFTAQFIPIPRVNQLLVISHSEAAWAYAERWLERMDTYVEGLERKIFVYPVENGKATELAEILNQVLGRSPTGARPEPRRLSDIHRTTPSSRPGVSTTPYGAPSTGQSSGATGATPGLFAAAQVQPPSSPAEPPRPAAPVRPEPRAAEPPTPGGPEDQVRIVPDPATNSLIVYATAEEFQNIKNILTQIDIVPRQVLMEVLVAEVTLADDLAFGIEYAIRRRGSAAGVNAALESKGALEGTLPSTFPTGLTSIITSGRDFRAIINALMNDARVTVLSHPMILAVDNQPARIQVGSEEPIATGTTTSQVGTVAQATTIQFRNLGRILTIIPQVNSQGLVNLQVKVEVSERGDVVRIGQDDFFSFDTRDAETTAVVQDGDTLAIGGIITDRRSRSRTGIPYLMDVPFLGRFFGVTTDDLERTELVILITPSVIRDREESDKVTQELLDKLGSVKGYLEKMEQQTEKEPQKAAPLPPAPPVPEESTKAPREPAPRVLERRPVRSAVPIMDVSRSAEVRDEIVLSTRSLVDKAADRPLSTGRKIERTSDVIPDEFAFFPGDIDGEMISEWGETTTEGPVIPLGKIFSRLVQLLTFGFWGERAPETHSVKAGLAHADARSERKAPIPAQVQEAAPPETGRRSMAWAVQLSALSREGIARSLADRLRKKGYDAYVIMANVDGRTWYRVQIGRLGTKHEAQRLQERLMSENYTDAFLAAFEKTSAEDRVGMAQH